MNMDPVVHISHLSIQCYTYMLDNYREHCIAHVHCKLLCDMTFPFHMFFHSNRPHNDMCKMIPVVYMFLGFYMVLRHNDRLDHIVVLSILHCNDKLDDFWKQYIFRYYGKCQNDNHFLFDIDFRSNHSYRNIWTLIRGYDTVLDFYMVTKNKDRSVHILVPSSLYYTYRLLYLRYSYMNHVYYSYLCGTMFLIDKFVHSILSHIGRKHYSYEPNIFHDDYMY